MNCVDKYYTYGSHLVYIFTIIPFKDKEINPKKINNKKNS